MTKNTAGPDNIPTILIVDDDETHRLLARDCLEGTGYHVIEAPDGEAGLALMRTSTVNVVLLDLMMPGRDGFSICREIKSDPTLRHISVIMATGSDDVSAVNHAFAAQADEFVTKPVHWSLLPYRVGFTLRNAETAEALRVALLESRAADEAKAQFLAAMGHELRTPLNAINGFSEILASNALGAANASKAAEYGGYILKSGRRLLETVNAILDMVKLQAGTFSLHLEPTTTSAVLEDCRDVIQDECKAAGHELAVTIDEKQPIVNADPQRLRQMILALVSNAVKFTASGGRVEVQLHSLAGGGAEIVVADTGIGMSPDEVALALKPFRQVDGRLSRTHEGAGLGLPIAKALAELHSGSLAVESTPAHGTRVIVTLPPRYARPSASQHAA